MTTPIDPAQTPTMSVEAAGKYIGIGRSLAYEAARTGELPTIRIGTRLLVPTAQLLALVGQSPDAQHQPTP